MGPARATGDAQNGPTGVHIPIGRPHPGEGRNHHDAAGAFHGFRQPVTLRGGVHQPQLVPQPLDGTATVKDAALQCIGGSAPYAPRHGAYQSRPAADRLRPHVHQGKAAGAVGILGLAGAEAALPEEGGLLVARRAADRDARELFKPRDAGLHAAIDLAV